MDLLSLNDHLSKIETSWTVLNQALRGSAERQAQAQEWFVKRYEPMVRRYLAKAVGPDAAEELSQEFAKRFLEGRYHNADPSRGRFRDYLKTCLFALVADFRKEEARKRVHQLPADGWEPADHRALGDSAEETWKLTWRGELIDRSLQALKREECRDSHFLYTVLKFRQDYPDLRSPAAAEKLSLQLGRKITAGWFRKRLMAGRERFAALLLDAVAESVENPTLDEVKEELADLGLLSYCETILDRLRA